MFGPDSSVRDLRGEGLGPQAHRSIVGHGIPMLRPYSTGIGVLPTSIRTQPRHNPLDISAKVRLYAIRVSAFQLVLTAEGGR